MIKSWRAKLSKEFNNTSIRLSAVPQIYDYNKIYMTMCLKSTPSKIKTTLIFIVFALINSFECLQSEYVIEEFKRSESLIEIHAFYRKHCKPSKKDKKAFIKELIKIRSILQNLFDNKKESIKDWKILHFCDELINKSDNCIINAILIAALSREHTNKSFAKGFDNIISLVKKLINQRYKNTEYPKIVDYAAGTDELRYMSISKNRLHKTYNELRKIEQQLMNSNFYAKYDRLKSVFANISTKFSDRIKPFLDLDLWQKQSHDTVYKSTTDNKYLDFPLSLYLLIRGLCNELCETTDIKANFIIDILERLKPETYLKAIDGCNRHVNFLFKFLNMFWLIDFNTPQYKDVYYKNLFDNCSKLWDNTYFKVMLLIYNEANLNDIKGVIDICLRYC